jgi:hypothetical protein
LIPPANTTQATRPICVLLLQAPAVQQRYSSALASHRVGTSELITHLANFNACLLLLVLLLLLLLLLLVSCCAAAGSCSAAALQFSPRQPVPSRLVPTHAAAAAAHTQQGQIASGTEITKRLWQRAAVVAATDDAESCAALEGHSSERRCTL